MDPTRTTAFIEDLWEASVLPTLTSYIEIPNKSPHFDADWQARGHMERALELIAGWS